MRSADMSADSTSAARETAAEFLPGDAEADDVLHADRVLFRAAFKRGAQWARSQPRVVSEAAVEAAAQAMCLWQGDAWGDISPEARKSWCDEARNALQAAYAVEEQQNG